MCIVLLKGSGDKLPKMSTLFRCWYRNKDGAGYVYHADGKNIIKKGYFSFKRLYADLKKDLTIDVQAIIHFRKKSVGLINVTNCHPFPLVNDVSIFGKEYYETNEPVMAHNGTLGIKIDDDKLSDTVTYVQKVLSSSIIKDNLFLDKKLQDLFGRAIFDDSSKVCFMTKSGGLFWFGEFIDYKGILYSNDGYKEYVISDYKTCRGEKEAYDENEQECKTCKLKISCVNSINGYSRWFDMKDKGDVHKGYKCDLCSEYKPSITCKKLKPEDKKVTCVCDDCDELYAKPVSLN